MAVGAFIFEHYIFDHETSSLKCRYRYEKGPHFEETIVFPAAARAMAAEDLQALDRALRLLFLLAGVSYYKAYAPEHLRCDAFPLDAVTAAFVEKVYRQGLGEFAYENRIDLTNRLRFAATDAPPPQAVTLGLPHRLCVPVGGGKDSVVSIEMLKQAGEPVTLFALGGASGPAAPIAATIAASGLPAVTVARTLERELAALNREGAYNGHVPITAILSAVAVVCAILQGFDAVVMSNEHSASAPNLVHDGIEVNHQYSKSFAFEQDFAAYVRDHVAADLAYFSLLRPLSEAAIARRFARLTAYHSIFRSCNTAFRQDEAARGKGWCCQCPKCRFVFLALAPFMPKPALVGIFGKNMLDDAGQERGFAELCGLDAAKPFECVGEIDESALLLLKLQRSADWENDAVVRALGPRLEERYKNFEQDYEALFALNFAHQVPERYVRMVHAGA